jgi:hypothetical protein
VRSFLIRQRVDELPQADLAVPNPCDKKFNCRPVLSAFFEHFLLLGPESGTGTEVRAFKDELRKRPEMDDKSFFALRFLDNSEMDMSITNHHTMHISQTLATKT